MEEVLSFRDPKNCPKCGVAPIVSQPPMREFDYVPCATIYCCGLQFSSDSLVEALSGWNAVCIGYSQAIADLAQAPAPVRVKPLVWEVCALPRHHENKWVAGPYTIRFVEDFFLVYGWDDKFKHTSVDLDDARAAAQADYSARILAALEAPDAGVVAELVESLREISALDDNAECCGQGVCGGYSPPECCNQPLYGLDRAQNIARAALAKWGVR